MAKSPPSADPGPARPGRGASARRRSAARLAAVQALYQIEITGAAPDAILRDILDRRIANQALADDQENEREVPVPLVEPDGELLTFIVRAASARRDDVDRMIDRSLSREWSPDRLEAVVRCILRAGLSELLDRPEVPVRVVISEYVDVAHAFYGGAEPGLVNAVLDRQGRLLREGEFGGAGGEDGAPR